MQVAPYTTTTGSKLNAGSAALIVSDVNAGTSI